MGDNSHPLQNTWVLWKHTTEGGKESCEELVEFSTVEDFWKAWNFIPKPSEVFFDGHSRPSGTPVTALSMTKKGIIPDASLKIHTSGTISFCKPMAVELLDHFWEHGVLGLVSILPFICLLHTCMM
jgi:translation initiation factor 4E